MIGRNGSGKSQTLRKLALKYNSNNTFNAVVCFSQFDKSNSFSTGIKNISHINLTKSKKNIEILQSMIIGKIHTCINNHVLEKCHSRMFWTEVK